MRILILLIVIAACRPTSAQDSSATEGYPTIHFRGRLDADFVWADQDAANRADFGTLPDAVGLRRARAGIFGELADNWRYLLEVDIASGDIVLRDG